MHSQVKLSCASEILVLRERYREEMNCQIVHDSIHRRAGWTLTYVLELDAISVGFGSIAIGGPWKDRPTLFEFYVLPQYRCFSFDLFETLLSVSGPQFMEIQSNDLLPTVMLHTYAHEIASEKIVFHDEISTALAVNGATLRQVSSDEEIGACIERRQGGPEWVLELDGKVVAQGGILFHYNRPYGDIYMEVAETSAAWARIVPRAGIEARSLRAWLSSLCALQHLECPVASDPAKGWIHSLRAHAHRCHLRRGISLELSCPKTLSP